MQAAEEAERLRIQALRQYSILDTPREEAFDNIVFLAQLFCNIPIVLISLIDESRQWFKASIGLELTETHRDISFCSHAITEPHKPLIIEDTLLHPGFASNPLVGGAPYIRFYAGFPIVDSMGLSLGALCVIDVVPRKLTDNQIAALKILAKKVMQQIEGRHRLKMLENSEYRFAAFMAHSPAIAFIKDKHGRYVYANQAFLDRFQRREHEVVGRNDFDLWPYPVARLIRANDLKVVTSRKKSTALEQVPDPDGSIRHWQVERFILDPEGLLGGVATNVSEIKESEELLKAEKVELELLSATDPLTGLKNRRGFWKEFRQAWAYAVRYQEPLSVLMLDLDYFKQVNDRLGHDGGDRLLKAVAGILKTDHRINDHAARYGGEEFTVLLPHTDEDGARILAERLRMDIAAIGVTTASIGVGCRTEEMAEPDDLLKSADVMLYRAKNSGRNCVRSPSSDISFHPNLPEKHRPSGR